MGQSNNDDDVFFDCKELSALLDIPQNDSGIVSKDINLIDPSIDPKIILASLCAKAPDFEVRDLLRAYSPENTLKYQKSVFNKWNKPILLRCAEYLQVSNSELRK